ncbi:MAG TPA: DUF6188 family protein [Roseiflexaceae bacterium]|nr:DUF6188 family protein [Roseiflexaceae bacterium]
MDLLGFEDVCSVSLISLRMSESEVEFVKTAIDYLLANLSEEELIRAFTYADDLPLPEGEEDDTREFLSGMSTQLQAILVKTVRDEYLPDVFKGSTDTPDIDGPAEPDGTAHAPLSIARAQAGGWTISARSYEINRFSIDEAINIQLTGEQRSADLRIEQVFLLTEGTTQHAMVPGRFDNLGQLFALLHKPITAATVSDEGRLELEIDRAVRLVVEPDQKYEAWTLSADSGLLVVCLPGGGVAVWESSE